MSKREIMKLWNRVAGGFAVAIIATLLGWAGNQVSADAALEYTLECYNSSLGRDTHQYDLSGPVVDGYRTVAYTIGGVRGKCEKEGVIWVKSSTLGELAKLEAEVDAIAKKRAENPVSGGGAGGGGTTAEYHAVCRNTTGGVDGRWYQLMKKLANGTWDIVHETKTMSGSCEVEMLLGDNEPIWTRTWDELRERELIAELSGLAEEQGAGETVGYTVEKCQVVRAAGDKNDSAWDWCSRVYGWNDDETGGSGGGGGTSGDGGAGGETGGDEDCATILTGIDCGGEDGRGIMQLLRLVLEILTAGVGILATIGLVVSGIQYVMARDDSGVVAKVKSRIFNIVIGLVAYGLMWIILEWLIPGGIM